MPFHSYGFILAFLPAALAAFHLLRRAGADRMALAFLSLASLVLYATWDWRYVAVVLPLIAADLACAHGIRRTGERRERVARALLIAGITLNLAALAYCRYGSSIVLAIGISFLAFRKIAFLVDVYRGDVEDLDWLRYVSFVLFFPKLLSGPIAYHSEIAPQLARLAAPRPEDAMAGVTLFTLGLGKKVLLADTLSAYASPLFDAAADGVVLDVVAAWGALLAYGGEIYFDFSGYTDMAIGAALLFGIRLPINFDAPYRARNIAEFWRRWHITLSRFLREYVFIPLSFSNHRLGAANIPVSLFVTMVLCGAWHGATWTYVIWGALHGACLVVQYLWSRQRRGSPTAAGAVLTFAAVTLAWAFFRAADVPTALAIVGGAAGLNGFGGPLDGSAAILAASAALVIACAGPTTQRLVSYRGPDDLERDAEPATPLRWKPSAAWSAGLGVLLAVCLMRLSRITEFIYFRF